MWFQTKNKQKTFIAKSINRFDIRKSEIQTETEIEIEIDQN